MRDSALLSGKNAETGIVSAASLPDADIPLPGSGERGAAATACDNPARPGQKLGGLQALTNSRHSEPTLRKWWGRELSK